MDALNNVPDWIIVTAAVVTALGVIWRKVVAPLTALLHRIEASLAYVEKEMSFNSGASMRDAIQRVDVAVRHLDERLTRIEQNTAHEEDT